MSARFDQDFWSNPSVETQRGLSPADLFGSQLPTEEHRACPEPPDTETPQPHFASVETLSLFVPDNYEPGYAYPLIVWLEGSETQDLPSLMSQISPQNYLGLALGHPPGSGKLGGLGQGADSELAASQLEDHLYDSVCRLRRCYHVHSERIYVAGFAEGATTALSLLLRRPEWLAGAIALHGTLPDRRRSLARFRDLQGKRVLLATGARDQLATAGQIVRTGRLLHSAGLDVTTRIDDAGRELTPSGLRQIDHWVMEALCVIA